MLFNTPLLQQERKQMLSNIPVDSCKNSCWNPEAIGASSRRTKSNSTLVTHTDVISTPETINIVLGSDCNLTCSYCCKFYSTAWARDVIDGGPYLDENRYLITPDDQLKIKLGQKKYLETNSYQILFDEIVAVSKNSRYVEISGGEPFLYNNLTAVIEKLNRPVTVYSGLGVSESRLKTMLNKIKNFDVTLSISAENCDGFYEFNRHGNSFSRFTDNLKLIEDAGIKYKFSSVISNLTIFGFADFLNKFKSVDIDVNFCNDPHYLSVHVLPNNLKQRLLENNYGRYTADIHKTLTTEFSQLEFNKFQTYIKKFVQRRNLDINIFPEEFVKWVN